MTRSFALALVLSAGPALAADGVVAKISGPVFIRAEGTAKDLPAEGGEEILYGDSVKTGPGGLAYLRVGARGAVLLRENAFLTLAGDPQNTRLKISSGEFLVGLSGKRRRGESLRAISPAASASVLAGLFWGRIDATKASLFAGLGGAVSVTAKGKTVPIHPGEETTVAFGEAPSEAAPSGLSLSAMDRFKIDGSLQGLESLADRPKDAAPAPKTASDADAPEDPDDTPAK